MLEVWRQRKRDLDEMRPLLEKELARLEEQKRRLVHAYVYEQAIDQETYRRELARIGEDLTLVRVEHHDNAVDSLDVEAVLEFAVLNARRLCEEFPLNLRRRMQKVLFPEGLVWSGEAVFRPSFDDFPEEPLALGDHRALSSHRRLIDVGVAPLVGRLPELLLRRRKCRSIAI